MSEVDVEKAQQLHQAAIALEEAGNIEEAITTYHLALQADPEKSESYYNLGLIHKYRNEWEQSRELNRIAFELDPEHEAACWNMAIAATALRDWETARRGWASQGIEFDTDHGPIESNFGATPVRLHPDGDAEVVWAARIDPVRARIENIPLPESGYRCGDIVLHDGAPVGYRMLGDQERPVFNVLELFEPSGLSTYQLVIDLETPEAADQFLQFFQEAQLDIEDWTASYRILCKQCSEGRPHEQHDHHLETNEGQWDVRRYIGIAARTHAEIETILAGWPGIGSADCELSCELAA